MSFLKYPISNEDRSASLLQRSYDSTALRREVDTLRLAVSELQDMVAGLMILAKAKAKSQKTDGPDVKS